MKLRDQLKLEVGGSISPKDNAVLVDHVQVQSGK